MTGTGLRGSSSLPVQPTQYSRQCLERPREKRRQFTEVLEQNPRTNHFQVPATPLQI